MSTQPDLNFEIDFANEGAGWLPCYLAFAGQRYELSASNVLPPFVSMLRFLRGILLETFPSEFYLDEEGRGAHFKAVRGASGADRVHLRIQHDLSESPWIEAEFERNQVIEAFLQPLWAFAQHPPGKPGEWNLPLFLLEHFERLQHLDQEARIVASEKKEINFVWGQSDDPEDTFLTLNVWVGDISFLSEQQPEDAPIWPQWFSFFAQVAKGALPAEFKIENSALRFLGAFGLDANIFGGGDEWLVSVRADSADVPENFRLSIIDSGMYPEDRLRIQEVLNRAQCLTAFARATEQFFNGDYHPHLANRFFDLHTLPLETLKIVPFSTNVP